MDADRNASLITFREIVAFEHLGDGRFGGEADEINGRKSIHPARIEINDRFFRIKQFENLRFVCLRIRRNLFRRQCRSRGISARWIANQSGKISDQKNYVVTELLEMAHLANQHCMSDV